MSAALCREGSWLPSHIPPRRRAAQVAIAKGVAPAGMNWRNTLRYSALRVVSVIPGRANGSAQSAAR